MNLYLRLLWTLLRCWRLPQLDTRATLERSLRVLPNDLDINGHMNNGRYLTVVDLMLIEFFVRTGFARVMLREGWRPMSGGAFISYRKGLQPMQRYRVRFALAGSDMSWNYMRFEFLRLDGTLCAAGFMKGAAVARSGLVPNEAAYARLGLAHEAAPLPDAVAHWLAAERSAIADLRG
jgi:acyl-CoA thioesterase FadM